LDLQGLLKHENWNRSACIDIESAMNLLLAQSTLPPPAAIREAAKNVVARRYYHLDSAEASDYTPLILKIFRWLLKPFELLFDSLEGLPEAVRWLIVLLCVVVCVALVAHIIYTLIAAIRAPLYLRQHPQGSTHKEYDPRDFEQQAELALSREDYIGAIRLLFRATLRRLELFEKKKFRPGITNRELLKRYRSSPLAESLLSFVNTIDLKWYGQMPCGQADFITCKNEHGRICQYIGDSKFADRS